MTMLLRRMGKRNARRAFRAFGCERGKGSSPIRSCIAREYLFNIPLISRRREPPESWTFDRLRSWRYQKTITSPLGSENQRSKSLIPARSDSGRDTQGLVCHRTRRISDMLQQCYARDSGPAGEVEIYGYPKEGTPANRFPHNYSRSGRPKHNNADAEFNLGYHERPHGQGVEQDLSKARPIAVPHRCGTRHLPKCSECWISLRARHRSTSRPNQA